jgi:glycosyltransferase involved in cell wall biosynthesis
MQPFVSIIIPTYNEEHYIDALFSNLLNQDFPHDRWEIIVADGRSSDRTREKLEAWQRKCSFLHVIDNPHRYVPHALNAALGVAKGDVIVRLDAHSMYPRNYVRRLVDQLYALDADNVGGMWITTPANDSAEAMAVALATSHPLGIGNAAYRHGAKGPTRVDTVPYGCFRRSAFERFGTFDEELLRNQDDEFNGRIIKGGGSIWLIPDLKIHYFARPTLPKMRSMFYQYGFYKPLVNRKLGSAATLRQFAPPALVLFFVVALFSYFIHPWVAQACLFLTVAYVFVLATVALQSVYHAMQATGKNLPPRLPKTVRWAIEAIGLGLFFAPEHWISSTVSNVLMTALIFAPLAYDALRLSPSDRRLFSLTFRCFPLIHFSYGIGYIFGIIRFRVRSRANSAAPHSIASNR